MDDDYERPSRALLERPSTFKDPDNYPAVSVHQPYAGLIQLAGLGYWGKEMEVRTKPTSYRGKLVICAAKRFDEEAYNRAKVFLVAGGRVPLDVFEAACGKGNCGKALALFEIDESRRMREADHALAFTSAALFSTADQHVWVAGHIYALTPFEVMGAQGFYRVPRVKVDSSIQNSTSRIKRINLRKAVNERLAKTMCPCGQAFPKHLAEFMNNQPQVSHDCRCGKKYFVVKKKFVESQPQEVQHGA
jgi:hypothetical protein